MIRLIAAIDQNKGLAKDHRIPWDLPKDKARFRQLTLTHGANVLMGSTTYRQMSSDYLSLRQCYVVSHHNQKLNNAILINDLKDFLAKFKQDLWIIGGAAIFEASIGQADELYLTLINKNFNCDQFFPDYGEFKLVKVDGPFNYHGLTFNYQLLTRF